MTEIIELLWWIIFFLAGTIVLGLYAFACALGVGMLNIRKASNRYLLFILCALVTPFIFSSIAIAICYLRERKDY